MQEEMAAILRFGAEELFREGEDVAEQAGQAVMEEELDAILARAEVSRATGANGLVVYIGWLSGCQGGRDRMAVWLNLEADVSCSPSCAGKPCADGCPMR